MGGYAFWMPKPAGEIIAAGSGIKTDARWKAGSYDRVYNSWFLVKWLYAENDFKRIPELLRDSQ
jgi:hypothetical protein